ncbi:MAG: bifunctional glutamate N-acetyltransferase/amino-acid acetyltransferase ArgJ [Gammaproteobacteria bacterium]|nr:bifunctional glutamate N-acetyltransferase/amino-acid acetyltransferase ArgJ [Gammaproteobacteria bacterium]
MAVNLPPPGELHPVPGVAIGTTFAGIKNSAVAAAPGRQDLVVVLLAEASTVAGVFTTNSFRAAPVLLAEEAIARGGVRALVINSGNANAATAAPGLEDARRVCEALADAAELPEGSVAPFSTGVIGVRLPVGRMVDALPAAVKSAAPDRWPDAARAIMTTDTGPKAFSRRLEIGGATVTFTGIAKGAGMIKPNMATMLGYVCCDARISQGCLGELVRQVADRSFNRITIDGDTSTNDAFVVCATGQAQHPLIDGPADPGYEVLAEALTGISQDLAQAIVRDGEGATRFVTVRVEGGANAEECLRVAYTVAESPLIKTAVFAGDPNWGRFCMAIGRSGIADLDTSGVNLYLDDVCVARGGLMADDYTEADGARVMAQPEFTVRIELGRGAAAETVWTTDLSYDYVKINAEYRT